MKNPAFQIRSSWAQFLLQQRFLLLDFSITCVFSTAVNIPIPPAGTIYIIHRVIKSARQCPPRESWVHAIYWAIGELSRFLGVAALASFVPARRASIH
jgi:hypothetical protein